MRRFFRTGVRILLIGITASLLSGCVLRSLWGNVIAVEDISDHVDEIITAVFTNATVAVCRSEPEGLFSCRYFVDGQQVTSTVYLLSEYGLAGVLIDPLILQVPADVTDITATYDDGSGSKPLVGRYVESFKVTPDTTVTAETGQTFLILELPPSATASLPSGDPQNGPQYDLSLQFKRVKPISAPVEPIMVKMMLTGKVVINEHVFYVPILPCVTDFADIPALEIPQSDNPVDLVSAVGNLIATGSSVTCNHKGYFFNNVPSPPSKVFLPQAFN